MDELWTPGGRLISPRRGLYFAPGGGGRYAHIVGSGAPSSPVAGSAFWYDSSNAGSITSSGGAVSQWNDLSGNARHLTQATGSKQPTTGTRTLNGLNVIDFDGTDDSMTSTSFSISQPITLFAVALNDAGADGAAGHIVAFAGVANAFLGKSPANQWRIRCTTNLADGGVDTAVHIFTAVCNGASSKIRVDAAETTGSAGTSGITTGIRLGRNSNAEDSYWNGYFAEVLGYASAFSAGDITLNESYLDNKWTP